MNTISIVLESLNSYQDKAKAPKLDTNRAPKTEGIVMIKVFRKYCLMFPFSQAIVKFSKCHILEGNNQLCVLIRVSIVLKEVKSAAINGINQIIINKVANE